MAIKILGIAKTTGKISKKNYPCHGHKIAYFKDNNTLVAQY